MGILDETAEEERSAICLNRYTRNWVDGQAKVLMLVLITVMMVQHFILSMVGICWEVICIHQCLRHLGSGETRIYQCMRSRREIATLECEGSGELRIYQCMRSFGIGATRASGDISSQSDGGNSNFGIPRMLRCRLSDTVEDHGHHGGRFRWPEVQWSADDPSEVLRVTRPPLSVIVSKTLLYMCIVHE